MDEKNLRKLKIGLNIEIIIFLIGILFSAYKNNMFLIILFIFMVIGDIIAIVLIDKRLNSK